MDFHIVRIRIKTYVHVTYQTLDKVSKFQNGRGVWIYGTFCLFLTC